ncbi:MAG: glycosyltransferase family 2 protein [Candidatus Saccharimonas sp.]
MAKRIPLISIIVPVYNEETNLDWHHKKMSAYLKSLNIKYEFIYTNDGSSDGSLDIIRSIGASDQTVRYISFSRNFGKEAATTAGLREAKGDAAVMIDSDGQHPIELIKSFIEEWNNGYMQVIGVRKGDGERRILKKIGSRVFYFTLRLLGSNSSSEHGLTDFRLIDRKIIDEYNRLSEHNRITRNLLDWLGFSRKLIPFEAEERHAGEASYSMRKLVKLAVDAVVKHSTRPLKFIGLVGIAISIFTAFLGIFIVIENYILGDPLLLNITGTALLAVFLSFMVGIVLVCQGLLALYIENVYYETQNRPLYIIEETN